MKHTGGVIFLSLTRRMKRFRSRIKTQPNVKQCKADFRVEKRDIPLLLDALRAPPAVYRMASWSYVQNITELKEGIKTHKV